MRVAVFGAGYAGLTVARRLERTLPREVELVVIDESGSHLVQHELHRVIRRPAFASTITLPLEDLLGRATVREGHVTEIDSDDGVARLDTGDGTERFAYDLGAICLGSVTEFYGLPGLEEHAIPLKSVEDANAIRESVTATPGGTAVVGGGGLSGVQAAGELAALSDRDGLDLEVRLIERESQVAPGFDASFGAALARELRARGVTVETDIEITAANETALECANGDAVEYDTLVWTGGIRGADAVDGRRLPTGSDLRVSPSTFVVGDAARVADDDGTDVPASAQTAVREGKLAARSIRRLVRARDGEDSENGPSDGEQDLSTYSHDALGWVVSVGDGAVAQLGPLVVNGEPARELKAVIGASHLGSVGEIERAADLVASELGWPTSDAADLLSTLDTQVDEIASLPTDPASFGDVQTPVVGSAIQFFDAAAGDATVDVTWLTGLTDEESAGESSLENLLGLPFEFLPSDGDKQDGQHGE